MKDSEHFLDKNTLLAILFIFIGWFAWDSYMKKKYPPAPSPAAPVSSPAPSLPAPSFPASSLPASSPPLSDSSSFPEEKEFLYKSPSFSFILSSQGMGFKSLVLNQVLDRNNQPIWLFASGKSKNNKNLLPPSSVSFLPPPQQKELIRWRGFETRLLTAPSKPLQFQIKQLAPHTFQGICREAEGVQITKTIQIKPRDFLVNTLVELSGKINNIAGISTLMGQIPPPALEKKTRFAFFSPSDFLSFFVVSAQGVTQIPGPHEDHELLNTPPFKAVSVAAVGSKYFGQAWMDKSEVLARFRFQQMNQQMVGVVSHPVLNDQQKFVVSYQVFIGPKSLNLLGEYHPKLIQWVDFGWFSSLARAILQVLRFFHLLVQNWGLSIILLTLLVRFLLLPLVLSSHRSMEVMKKIQPEIKKMREKFKSDPQRMNREVMALMKAHRANPLGGCLPMLCQIPVFWALWKALANSYSLYRSPFVFWIQDLSWKDPYYVLPAGIGALMFLQQKIFPASMSPEMSKAMQILPIFMILFMINLPSGLTLYVFVSSLFGLIQQLYLNKHAARSGSLLEVEK